MRAIIETCLKAKMEKRARQFNLTSVCILLLISIFMMYYIGTKIYANAKNKKAIEVVRILETIKEPIPIDTIPYGAYPGEERPNCVDYAFVFATLYGCEVGLSWNHAFCIIKGKVIEPQQMGKRSFNQDYRMETGADYYVKSSFTISESDKELIRSFIKKIS